MVKVLFFGVLTEICGTSSLEVEAADTNSLQAVLEAQFPGMKAQTFRLSLNEQFVQDNAPLSEGDEVAFLPPFAGG